MSRVQKFQGQDLFGWYIQKQAPGSFCKKGSFKNFAKFIGKHLYRSLFLNKVAAATLLKKRLQRRCFPVNFVKFLRTLPFRTLLVAASVYHYV